MRNGDGFEKAVAVDFSSWDVNRILEINHVHPKLRKKLTGVDAHWLLSWLLYAMSQAGRGIEQPLNYALDRLSRTPGKGVGGAYDAFANLPPAELIDLILERGLHDFLDDFLDRISNLGRHIAQDFLVSVTT